MRLARLPEADLESQMDDLRIFKQINTLRICAADVAGQLPLMKVSDRLTCLAEAILDWVMDMAWDHMVEKYGFPSGGADSAQKGFGIIAYGKLGGLELGYGSDLDLVFLHTGDKGYTRGGQLQPVDNAQFYVRLGQRIIHLMTAMTQTGKLYEMDMRLRPSGSAGILVTHIEGFEDYQKKDKGWYPFEITYKQGEGFNEKYTIQTFQANIPIDASILNLFPEYELPDMPESESGPETAEKPAAIDPERDSENPDIDKDRLRNVIKAFEEQYQ